MAASEDCDDEGGATFFCNLMQELVYGAKIEQEQGYERIGAIIMYRGDGECVVECHNPRAPLWGGDPRIIQKVAESIAADAEEWAAYEAEQEVTAREEAAKRRKEATRRKRAAQGAGAAKRKRRQPTVTLPPRKPIQNKEAEVHTQVEPRDRCVAQDDDEEMEEMEWLNSFEPSTKQPIRLRPLILQMVDSCITTHANDGLIRTESTEDDVD